MKRRYRLMAWDLGEGLSLVDEASPTKVLSELCGRSELEVFEAVFSPIRKAQFESGKITWEDQFEYASDRLGLDIDLGRFTEIYNSALEPNVAVFPLVNEMMGQIRCGVASNTSEPHWQLERSRLPFGSRLDPEVISCRVGAMKPDRQFFEALCSLGDVEPQEVVFTDDREDNVAGAAELGITALLYRGHEHLRTELRSLGFRV